jgi:hypothetical protein
MTSALDDSLLDNPARLAQVDSDGLLRSAAMAGAQVRATAETARESNLAELAGVHPRALVMLTRPGLGPAAASVLVALLQPSCPVPLVVTGSVPSWIGPLDVVLTHTDDPGDLMLAESVDRAGRFGASIVITAPSEGPVAAAGAGKVVLLPPRVPVPPGFGFSRVFAAGLLTLNVLGLLHTNLDTLADELDREAERDHMQHESFVNPAKSLALRLAERSPLLWGLDDVATAVAGHAVQVLATHTDLVCDVAGYPQAMSGTALHRAAVQASSGQDIFADPEDLQPHQASPLRVFLLAVRSAPGDAMRRLAAETLPGADVIAPVEEISADEPSCAAVLALRFELAALYLGLAAGTTGGSGRYVSGQGVRR